VPVDPVTVLDFGANIAQISQGIALVMGRIKSSLRSGSAEYDEAMGLLHGLQRQVEELRAMAASLQASHAEMTEEVQRLQSFDGGGFDELAVGGSVAYVRNGTTGPPFFCPRCFHKKSFEVMEDCSSVYQEPGYLSLRCKACDLRMRSGNLASHDPHGYF
jgi:hypothetical protein